MLDSEDSGYGGRLVGRLTVAVGVVGTALVLAGGNCGNEMPGADVGQSCESSKDCIEGLLCRQKVCVEPGGQDGETDVDAGDVGDVDGGGTDEPTREDYYISYVLEEGRSAEGQLRVFNTADGSDVAVSPQSINCSFNCWLSRDMEHFVYTESAGPEKVDVYVAEVGSDLKAKGTGSKLVGDVKDVTVDGEYVAYQKAGGNSVGYYKPIDGGGEKLVGAVDADWYVDPSNDIAVLYSIGDSAQTMTMTVGKAKNRDSDSDYVFGGDNFQEESGSYFGNQVLTKTSPDGDLLALVTRGAPNDYQRCSRSSKNDPWSSEKCESSDAFKCGERGRCTRLEVTVHVVDVDNADNLGESCSFGADGACGPIHECYAPSAKQANLAECIPQRVAIGVPRTKQGPMRQMSGCELVQSDGNIDYTNAKGPLSFDAKGRVYLVGARDRSCIENQFNEDSSAVIPNSEIIRVDPKSGSYKKLRGLPSNKLFNAGRCYNDQQTALEIDDDCHFWVDRARVSPGSNEIAFTATNPSTSTPAKANDFVNLWHMLRDGSEVWFTGDKDTSTVDTTRSYLRVHPPKE